MSIMSMKKEMMWNKHVGNISDGVHSDKNQSKTLQFANFC